MSESDRQVEVVERRSDGARHYLDRGVLYTSIGADGANAVPYIDAMAEAVCRYAHVLVLGTAGGALPTMLSRLGVRVTAVDIWPGAFQIARAWFHLPDTVRCVAADAVEFLAATDESWDAVAIDIFDGLDIPDALFTAGFGRDLARATRPEGLVVWNVAAGLFEDDTLAVAQALTAAGFQPRARSVHGDPSLANTLVLAQRAR